jgi:hypothetical protein
VEATQRKCKLMSTTNGRISLATVVPRFLTPSKEPDAISSVLLSMEFNRILLHILGTVVQSSNPLAPELGLGLGLTHPSSTAVKYDILPLSSCSTTKMMLFDGYYHY